MTNQIPLPVDIPKVIKKTILIFAIFCAILYAVYVTTSIFTINGNMNRYLKESGFVMENISQMNVKHQAFSFKNLGSQWFVDVIYKDELDIIYQYKYKNKEFTLVSTRSSITNRWGHPVNK